MVHKLSTVEKPINVFPTPVICREKGRGRGFMPIHTQVAVLTHQPTGVAKDGFGFTFSNDKVVTLHFCWAIKIVVSEGGREGYDVASCVGQLQLGWGIGQVAFYFLLAATLHQKRVDGSIVPMMHSFKRKRSSITSALKNFVPFNNVYYNIKWLLLLRSNWNENQMNTQT